MSHDDLCFASAVEIATWVREKKVSPVGVTEAFLTRIDQLNPTLNAYVTLTPELAREAAKQAEAAVMAGTALGPLQGVPFSVKDLVFTYPFNLTGNPAASVPCGWTADGVPIGMQIIGRRFAEAVVLQASAAFEQLRPWAQRKPALE